ncbi:hypothetical protein M885DRAFT_528329 [Pelagophyceae sp. CCMP2097]|nr:hypothetical protein M885DRAFT_528329 [Pelagophyceae sp. CCMP2097]
MSMWKARAMQLQDSSKDAFKFVWRHGGRVVWVVAVTSLVMVLPLLMEIEREGSVIDLEKLQIKELRSQGFTDQQIQSMGLAPAVEPSVGLAA